MVHTHPKVSLRGVDSATEPLLRPVRVRQEHDTGVSVGVPRDGAGSSGNDETVSMRAGLAKHCGVCNPALPYECVRCTTIVADSTRLPSATRVSREAICAKCVLLGGELISVMGLGCQLRFTRWS